MPTIGPHHELVTSSSHPHTLLLQAPHLLLGLSSGHCPSDLPITIPYAFLSPLHATCPDHLIVLDLIDLIIFGEEYKLWNYSFCKFPHSYVNYFLSLV